MMYFEKRLLSALLRSWKPRNVSDTYGLPKMYVASSSDDLDLCRKAHILTSGHLTAVELNKFSSPNRNHFEPPVFTKFLLRRFNCSNG